MWRLSQAFAFLCALSTPGLAAERPPRDPAIERKIDALLGRMTDEEKAGQLSQLGADPKTGGLIEGQADLIRAGKVGSVYDVRGARNVNAVQKIAVAESPSRVPLLFAFNVIHGYRTIFPVPLGEASSWDPASAERSARVAAAEAAATGVRWTFAPMVDIARDPRWGRIVEGSGEDPFLGAAMARARVRGFQGDDFADPTHLVACAKHWVAYGAAEGGRDYNAADVSERTLRTIYFPPFKAAVDAGAGTFMSALNALDGVPGSANPWSIGTVLRGEWGFDGLVIADYKAVAQLVPHGLAADEADAARLAILAGVDMDEDSSAYVKELPGLVRGGAVPRGRLDEAVRRALRLKFRLGLFDHPYVDESRETATLLTAAHRAAAREVAGRSLVLLKNDGGVLPVARTARRIAVVGPMADNRQDPVGPWFAVGKAEETVSLLDAIREKLGERAASLVVHAQGCDAKGGTDDGIDAAVKAAAGAEVAIVAVGEPSDTSGEATSRSSLDLPGHQMALIRAVQATGTPTVVVLTNGRPLTIAWTADHVAAILETWYAGTEAGHAIADALFGDVNPGGKLPVTFPRSVGEIPMYYNDANSGRPAGDDKYTSKYIDEPLGPLWPFGHGLSYTRFRLDALRLDAATIPPDGRVGVSVEVVNVGDRAGDEVVQVYIRDVAASVVRPVRELCGFERVSLRPGERKTVRFTIGPEALGFYDRRMRFVVEPGLFRVMVGTSSVGGLEADLQVTAHPQ
jgi:beta-glucosidase